MQAQLLGLGTVFARFGIQKLIQRIIQVFLFFGIVAEGFAWVPARAHPAVSGVLDGLMARLFTDFGKRSGAGPSCVAVGQKAVFDGELAEFGAIRILACLDLLMMI